MKYRNRSALVFVGACIAAACGGGGNDDEGETVVVSGPIATVTSIPAGEVCQAGGVLIRSGVDDDGDGVVSEEEETVSYNICAGDDGSATDGGEGPAGNDGSDGADGTTGGDGAVTLSSTASATVASCPAGGTVISFGPDVDGSGILESSEVSSTTTICNGAGGGDSCSPVVKVTPVSPGALCVAGGVLIEYGADSGMIGAGGANAGGAGAEIEACNGLLDPGEEMSSELVCNGAPGADGADGQDGVDGQDGMDGQDGEDGEDGDDGEDGMNGMDGLPGMDGDDGEDGLPGADGMPGAPGMNGTDGAPGTDGTNMAVRLTFVAAGDPTCANGGMLLESGVDDDNNGVLDAAEVDEQNYSCF